MRLLPSRILKGPVRSCPQHNGPDQSDGTPFRGFGSRSATLRSSLRSPPLSQPQRPITRSSNRCRSDRKLTSYHVVSAGILRIRGPRTVSRSCDRSALSVRSPRLGWSTSCRSNHRVTWGNLSHSARRNASTTRSTETGIQSSCARTLSLTGLHCVLSAELAFCSWSSSFSHDLSISVLSRLLSSSHSHFPPSILKTTRSPMMCARRAAMYARPGMPI